MIKFTLTLNNVEAEELLQTLSTGISCSSPHPAGTERLYQKLKEAFIILQDHVVLIEHAGLDENGKPVEIGRTEHTSLNMAAVYLALATHQDSSKIEESLEEHGVWAWEERSWELAPPEFSL